jgi:hypothetical protein
VSEGYGSLSRLLIQDTIHGNVIMKFSYRYLKQKKKSFFKNEERKVKQVLSGDRYQ